MFDAARPPSTPKSALCVPEEELGKARRTGIRGARGLITVLLFTSPRFIVTIVRPQLPDSSPVWPIPRARIEEQGRGAVRGTSVAGSECRFRSYL
jgi:hypothetical protein